MNPELTQKLYDDFPDLYQDHNKSMRTTAMCWGFECGDGWFDIIYELSETLTKLSNRIPVATQVKEKFGSLRFYTDIANSAQDEAIDTAESRSMYTCESCGAPGKISAPRGWLKCRCEECLTKEEELRNASRV